MRLRQACLLYRLFLIFKLKQYCISSIHTVYAMPSQCEYLSVREVISTANCIVNIFVTLWRANGKMRRHSFPLRVSRAHLEQGKLKTNLNYQPKSIFYAWISNQIIWVTVWGCFWVLFSTRLRLTDWIEWNPIKSGATYFRKQSYAGQTRAEPLHSALRPDLWCTSMY